MMHSPLVRQIFVAGAPQIAALAAGGTTSYAAVLYNQLRSNDSSIHIDTETVTWIASVHGLAGILSIVMPTIMQIKGRKFALNLSCILILVGWGLIFFAKTAAAIIIGECFHAVGSSTFHIVSFAVISEMAHPKIRSISMSLLSIFLTIGMALGNIVGRLVHWKNVCLILSPPLIIALVMIYFWPESPFWLAHMKRIEDCKEAFIWLRGNDDESQKELMCLVKAHNQATVEEMSYKIHGNGSFWKSLCQKISRRDFYMPCFHVFVIMATFYWSGPVVFYIYGKELIESTTKNTSLAFHVITSNDICIVICAIGASLTVKYIRIKTILLTSIAGCAVSLLIGTVLTLSPKLGLADVSYLYFYSNISLNVFNVSGWLLLSYSISAEIIPVKHRGLGGAVYTLINSVLHTSTAKSAPYMFKHFELWGTLLTYTISAVIGFLFVWRCVPDSQGRTLQEIEYYYNHGCFETKSDEESDVHLNLKSTVVSGDV